MIARMYLICFTKIINFLSFNYFSFEIVESIPDGMKYPNYKMHTSTFDAWESLLKNAEKTIDIAALYWNLRDKKKYKTSWQVFNLIFQSFVYCFIFIKVFIGVLTMISFF